MAKLKALAPRLAQLRPRIGYAPGDEKARLQQRDVNVSWRAWYKTARWQKLRRAVLLRDMYTCQRTGVLLTGKYPAPNSPVVDHKQPHRGDEVMFWDINNLMAVSKEFHDSQKQSEERRR